VFVFSTEVGLEVCCCWRSAVHEQVYCSVYGGGFMWWSCCSLYAMIREEKEIGYAIVTGDDIAGVDAFRSDSRGSEPLRGEGAEIMRVGRGFGQFHLHHTCC
jgi:hypothetical protein